MRASAPGVSVSVTRSRCSSPETVTPPRARMPWKLTPRSTQAGSRQAKTIAINLPNDEKVQLEKGTRRLQLKNAVRAKFDRILVPLAKELIVDDLRFSGFGGERALNEIETAKEGGSAVQ